MIKLARYGSNRHLKPSLIVGIRPCEPSRILRVFTTLNEHQAAEIAFLESLVATPTMHPIWKTFLRRSLSSSTLPSEVSGAHSQPVDIAA
jgi:hypothetical protein